MKTIVELTYFKPYGKYYTSGQYETNCEHMFQIFDEVKKRKEIKALPGLADCSWEGPILVMAPGLDSNYPGLIV